MSDARGSRNPLHHRTVPARGDARGRLVLLHGFTQNTECWGRLPELLRDDFDVVLVDGPGHGRSGHDDADLWIAADLIAEVGGEAHYLGYSMGGRMALHLALAHPDLVRSLTLVGATAGLDDADERAARRSADRALADRLIENGLESFLESWLSNPLFASLPEKQASRAERLMNRPEGLAASLRHVGTGMQEPLWARLHEIAVPALVLVGDQDDKFTALGMRLIEELPRAAMASAPGGHAIHSEHPEAVATRIRRFLSTV